MAGEQISGHSPTNTSNRIITLTPAIKSTRDFWAGLLYVGIGGLALILSRDYEMGSALRMGPAYLPALLGGLLVLIGAVSLGRSFFRPGAPITGFQIKGLVLVTAATLLFGILVRGAGLAIALPLLVIMSSAASRYFRWGYAFILAVGLTLFCSLVFLKGLGVPLPFLGSWFSG